MDTFTIKDLENLSGIKAHTIRIWEQRYSFLKPKRTGTNIRRYSNDELKTILNIALLNKYGYKISHIDRMADDDMKEKILSLSVIQAQHERIINDLLAYMVDSDVEGFEIILDNYILSRGIEKTILHIIFPFLEKIGVLWLTNHINPAQEHLVTNIIRQKLIMGIENTGSRIHLQKTALLFLPEGEHHELGLLFASYLLKRHGAQVLYLGANLPLDDVGYIVKLKNPDFLYTHLISVAPHFSFEKFLLSLKAQSHGKPVIISGRLAQLHKKKLPANIHLKKSLAEVMEYISAL